MKNAVVAAAFVAVAASGFAATIATAGSGRCDAHERSAALRAEQSAVLEELGELTTLKNEGDLARLAIKGYDFLPHQYTSFAGQGIGILHLDRLGLERTPPPTPGDPVILLYAPRDRSDDATDPRGPDYPYNLAGWGYLDEYDYDQEPTTLPCIPRQEWFVHERGIHPFESGRMEAHPPEESFHGEADGSDAPEALPPDIPHGRFWDIHFFLDNSGVPQTCITHPTDAIQGVDSQIGVAFFYPPDPSVAAEASAARDCPSSRPQGEASR